MKKTFLLSFILAVSVIVMAQEKTPYMTKSLSSESVKNVEVETSGGGISVTGVSSASETKVEVYIVANNGKNDISKEEIESRLAQYELTVAVSNNKLTAIAKPKERDMNWKKGLSISFKVYVLKNVATDLATSGGSISLNNLNGDQKFVTSGGSLNVDNVGGKIDGRTSGGSIKVKNSKDDIELATSGGSIDAENCEGKLRLSTSGGSIKLNDLKGDIKATTSGGGIKGDAISGGLIATTSGGSIKLSDLACDLETSTSGGGIDISITSLGKYVKIRNSGGSINLQLPKNKGLDLDIAANKIKTDQLSNFTGKAGDDELEGKINGGGIPVNVRSSGNVSLVFK